MGLVAAIGRSTPLRLLLIEDDPADALLIVRELQRSAYDVAWDRVQTATALRAAIQQERDLITCDWALPAFSAPAALQLLQEHGVDLPVIIVSGQAAEEVTVTAMKAGAHDVVSKRNLARLAPAVERELRDADERRARRRAEMALKESEARYRRLFETARDGIFILDAATGQIIDANPFLLEVLGCPREQLVGRPLWELGPFQDIAASPGAFRDLQGKDFIRYEHFPLAAKGGQQTDVELIGNAFQINGRRVIQCNLRDISDRKRTERASAALNAELERRVEERTAQAAAINKELAAFGDSVSHDLRAPLRHVEEFSKLLRLECSAQLDSRGQLYLDRIQACTQRMSQLITDLLKLSRMTGVQMMPQAVDLSALCETVLADLRRCEPRREVESVVAPGIVAQGDPGLLRVALENLLGNAWKYTSQHPAARIEFGTIEQGGRPAYFVRDDGAGFDMARAGKLFAAFQRLHGEAEFAGTGIGLATVQRIIHRHGGRLWAESAVERGTTIYFTLGAAPSAVRSAVRRA